jgi:putative membrane protein insertion efficiency factor
VNSVRSILLLAIRVYRFAISPILTTLFAPLGLGCRFTPTCSHYALDAVRFHGVWHGSILIIRRLCRCHPWGGSGHDPVPHPNLNPNPNRNRLSEDPTVRPQVSVDIAAGEHTRAPKTAH